MPVILKYYCPLVLIKNSKKKFIHIKISCSVAFEMIDEYK